MKRFALAFAVMLLAGQALAAPQNIDVRDYSPSAADWGPALSQAIQAATAQNLPVYIPPGQHTIKTPVYWLLPASSLQGLTIQGNGAQLCWSGQGTCLTLGGASGQRIYRSRSMTSLLLRSVATNDHGREGGAGDVCGLQGQRRAASEQTMIGRRLKPIDGELPPLADFQPGDYCGPVTTYTAGIPTVMYRLPTPYMSFGHCESPPHKFRECADGSLEIRDSILHTSRFGVWHGYLDEGNVWRQV